MKWIRLAALLGVLAWPAASISNSNDFDLDGVADEIDNCLHVENPGQDDTDRDDCGNLCDADYDQNGIVGFGDFGIFADLCFKDSPSLDPVVCHVEPIPGCTCGFGDFGFFAGAFGEAPGPSGITPGWVSCPR